MPKHWLDESIDYEARGMHWDVRVFRSWKAAFRRSWPCKFLMLLYELVFTSPYATPPPPGIIPMRKGSVGLERRRP